VLPQAYGFANMLIGGWTAAVVKNHPWWWMVATMSSILLHVMIW
jgi:hypothetical protein